MRLKSVYISQYKNLKDFLLTFDGTSFIDVFVGKNGTGKSNLFEALIEIFRHLYEFEKSKEIVFNYKISYELKSETITVEWDGTRLLFNGQIRKTTTKESLPDNILIYYSGHNETVSNLVTDYQDKFSKRIKAATFDESRRFIGIGSEYKGLLLAIMLMQKPDNKAREYICRKLGIQSVTPTIKLSLKRPVFAKKSFQIDDFDATTHFWGTEGATKGFLVELLMCIKGEFKHKDIYNRKDDKYILEIDTDLFRKKFGHIFTTTQFRFFDNLKTLDMLLDISTFVTLNDGSTADISQFSDGQFQSVYIYSVVELFKDRNCITLLDEPDSFLHPEWQFEFLKQVFDIAETTTQNNHVLMTSHSASTITTSLDAHINLFEMNVDRVVVNRVTKSDVIKALSSGLITFSESEARLNIHHVLNNTTGAVLFTEGITDEMILEIAWSKLYPGKTRRFEIQNAYGCSFLRNLMKDEELYRCCPDRVFFAIFDFDNAYNDWSQLGTDVQSDPFKCLTKKYKNYQSYSMLLPVPGDSPNISRQVININNGTNYGCRSLLTIELLFYGVSNLEQYFTVDLERTDGFIKFISDTQKEKFAKDIVPGLDATCFEVFRPIFKFIESKC